MPTISSSSRFPADVRVPKYTPAKHGAGIVHFGIGAFHRAHQAVATDDALAAYGGDWRIIGVSPRSTEIADALNAQDGLFTVLERAETGTSARIIGSIAYVIATSRHPADVLAALARPTTRIVSITITEKAYGFDRSTGGIDPKIDFIAADLADHHHPTSTIGMIVEGLRLRREANLTPYSVMCCDNLPDNGNMVRHAVLDFARRVEPDLANWIEAEVAFPSTMVDRITPASTAKTLVDARTLTGHDDLAPVETEPFFQWVIEDNFTAGRPAWETGGALLVGEVAPYEHMKLRMLNGAHSLIAYAGFLAGHPYVRDAMKFAPLATLAKAHMQAASTTLKPLTGIDFKDYAAALATRFANPAIAHQTFQIAMDGTEKLPQRIFDPAVETLSNNGDIRTFAFATAAWMRYCLEVDEAGKSYDLRDPRQHEINSCLGSIAAESNAIAHALEALPGLFPAPLATSAKWRETVRHYLKIMLEKGMATAIETIATELA